jgi:hypothetical protein
MLKLEKTWMEILVLALALGNMIGEGWKFLGRL